MMTGQPLLRCLAPTLARNGDTDMSRELALPKASPRDVALAIIDGIEAGQEDIYPDPFAVEFGRQFASSPKASERQIAAMMPAMVSSSAA